MSMRFLTPATLLAGLLAHFLAVAPGLRAGEKVCPAHAAAEPKLIQKHYLVADLVTAVGEPAPAATEPAAPVSGPFCTFERKVPTCGANVSLHQQLITLITHTIAPRSWSSEGGPGTVDYFPLGMTLVVRQTPDVQEQVADLLAALRRLQDQEVALEVRVVTVDDAFFRSRALNIPSAATQPAAATRTTFINDFSPNQFISGITPAGTVPADRDIPNADAPDEKKPATPKVTFLDKAQFYSFMTAMQSNNRSSVMQAPKLTMSNGQEGTLKCLDRQFYVGEVELISNGHSLLFLPKSESCETGLKLSLQPLVSGDQRFVRLRLNGTLTSLLSLSPLKINTLIVDNMLCIPDGSTALLHGWKREVTTREESCVPVLSDLPYIGGLFTSSHDVRYTEHVMLLVTPHVIVPKEEEKVSTGCISNPALVQDSMPPAPGGQEMAEAVPAPPAPPATAPKVDVEKTVAKLLKKYEKACKMGDLVRAKKYARKAISLDPACFSSSRRTKAPLKQSDAAPQSENEWIRFGCTDQPSHMTYDRIHGGIK